MDISVAIPAHNVAAYIGRALHSVLTQAPQPAEVVVVDDASTDGTRERAGYSESPLLRVIRRESSGPGGYAARNAGIEAASATWVAFLDADDEWLPGHLHELRELHERCPEAVLLSTGWRVVGAEQQTQANHYTARYGSRGAHRLELSTFVSRWATGRAPAWTSAVCVRRDVLKRVGGFPEGRCVRGGDVDTWLRVMLEGRVAAYSPKVNAVYHRDVDGSVTGRLAPEIRHCTGETIRRALHGQPGLRLAYQLKRLANAHKKDPLRKKARYHGLHREDIRMIYPLADPAFFLLACLLWLAPRCLVTGALTLRDRAVRVRRKP